MTAPPTAKPAAPAYANALITGASRGIGRAIALQLASLGYRVFLLGRDQGALDTVAAACPPASAATMAGDLRDVKFIDTAIADAIAFMGTIDVLINNAGAAVHGAVQDADMSAWRDVLDVNFMATAHLTRHVLPGMIERGSGAIINISSINARHVNAGSAIYAATKHALNGFSGCLFEDVREHGVKVSTIMPGFVATDMTAPLGKDHERMIRPDDIADAVVYVLSASAACCPTEIVIRPQRQP